MSTSSNIGGEGLAPPCPPGGDRRRVAQELPHPQRQRPFCYSVTWLALPASDAPASLNGARFWYSCAYAENPGQVPDLVASADAALVSATSCAVTWPSSPR
jgi:hypothetical protein